MSEVHAVLLVPEPGDPHGLLAAREGGAQKLRVMAKLLEDETVEEET